MNTRICVELDERQKAEICFPELLEEHEQLFRNYMEESRHLQEITQLYQMMLFDLDEIFSHYTLCFNDTVVPVDGEEINMLQVNALIGNAVSAARTLIESMEIFDKVYLSEEGIFKNNYLSRAYDDHFSYRFIDFMRNYMQHGHVPVSFDGKRIFFQISEMLDVSHMKINSKLKAQMKDVEKELFDYGAMETRLAVVPTLYQYFLIIHTLVLEFFQFVKNDAVDRFCKVNQVLLEHPEYMIDIREEKFVGVYLDAGNMMHGFFAAENVDSDIDYWIEFAQLRLEQYKNNNGHLFFLKIQYCLENRMPVMRMVGDDDLSKNIEAYCLESGADIHYLSFDDYYGKMMMHSIYRLYPFIQYEDGVRWNVPYQEVTFSDFLRTFPKAREQGLKVYANNVGGAEDLFQTLMQDWSGYLYQAKMFLGNIGIHSPIDLLDWASRIAFVWQGMKWFSKSFSKKKEHKPRIKELRLYIRQRDKWDLTELAENLHAESGLLELVLQESGYVCKNEGFYKYDEEIAAKLAEEHQQYLSKINDCHGTNVNCYSMNQAVERLNVDLLYLAVLKMEQGKLEDYDIAVQEILLPLKKCEPFLYWDELSRCIRILDVLPDDFSVEDEEYIWECLEKVEAELACIIENMSLGAI